MWETKGAVVEEILKVGIQLSAKEDPGDNLSQNKRSWLRNLSRRGKILLLLTIIITPLAITALWYFFWSGRPLTYMVPMRDGVHLATDVYLPAGTGPFPVLLYRTPYDKNTDTGPTYYRQNDVAIVAQDFRGCHASGGIYDAWGTDAQDAYDTVLWLEQQSWYNGIYVTYGASARGITQYMQVQLPRAGLACQAITVATPDLYSIAMFQGGAPHKMLAENWLDGIHQRDYYEKLFEHPFSNDSYAFARRIDEWEWSNVTWPSIHVGGWYDCFGQGTLEGFMGYQYKGGTGGKGQARLFMGPWTHDVFNNHSGELIYPNANSAPRYYDIFNAMSAEQVFDSMQFGDYRTMSNVTYYVMGDVNTTSTSWNRWANATDWPVPYNNQTWYFQQGGVLSQSSPVTNANLSYVFDPASPVETRGGANLDPTTRGPYDQRPVENLRTDISHFDVSIATPLLITGRIWAHLFVTSNCTDTDFTVKLCDMYPGGAVMLICDGIIRMRAREGQDHEAFMDGSGTRVYEAWVDLWSTSYVFNAGHTLRVSISSSNYPRFDVNPNTGDPIAPVTTATHMHCANNTVIFNATCPSGILLPIPTALPSFIS